MNTLDLFSGIGGFSYGLKTVCNTIAYCESDELCRSSLTRNIKSRKLTSAPILEDVRDIDIALIKKLKPIMITAGSPCQDVSCANTKGEGITGPRSKIIFEVFKILDMVPSVKCVLFENSSCIVRRGIELVLSKIHKRGWKYVWGIFPASEVGCCHERKRWFCLAYDPGFQFKSLRHKKRSSVLRNLNV